jgi:hypothetical protein
MGREIPSSHSTSVSSTERYFMMQSACRSKGHLLASFPPEGHLLANCLTTTQKLYKPQQQVPPKSSFKKFLLSTGLWWYAKMSTTLKSPDRLKISECEKGQLSNQKPILYVAKMDIAMPKEEPQVMKVKLPNIFHINMPVYSRGNTKEYLTHIIAVLCIIKQKGLDTRCRKLGTAVVRQ